MFRKLYLFFILLFFCSCSVFKSSDKIQFTGSDNLLKYPDRDSVSMLTKKVADWQIKNFTYSEEGNLHDYGIDSWTNSTLYLGMFHLGTSTKENSSYIEWIKNTLSYKNWELPSNFADFPKYSQYHADELCIAQTYLYLYELYKDQDMLNGAKQRIDWIINNPPDISMNHSNKQTLSWCDAIFMAPPVYAQLASITGDTKYLENMNQQVIRSYNHLFDKEEKLFFRDDSYFDKLEANGRKVFWARGNGWVIAGMANILKQLPQKSEYSPFYEDLLKQLAKRLSELQHRDGFWHASLLDPDSYPSPEISATALIAYGIAYGINAGILPLNEYYPVLIKSWDALRLSIDEDGKLGWIQPIGASPKTVTKDMTAVYGVGAFLLAGTEINQILKNYSK